MEELLRSLRDKRVEYDRIKKNLIDEEVNLRSCLDDLSNVDKAQRVIQQVGEQCQERAHRQIALVVTRCLETVFGAESYDFQILFDRKRGKTEARLVFVRNKMEIDPLNASGGGVVDVASFALRLACLVLSRPRRRFFLVLDEPFRMISAEYQDKVREMILSLSKEMGVQFLLVTHHETLAVGKVVEMP